MDAVRKIKLGQLEERRELNPRGKLSHEVIQEYVRRLHNGETPPPIVAHRQTGVIFDGAHRYHAWKEFAGERWQEQEVPVIFRDDLPDPEESPELFRLAAVVANREHGLRVSRADKGRVIAETVVKRGREILERHRAALGETQESLEEIIAAVTAAYDVFGKERGGSGLGMTPERPMNRPAPASIRYRPESFPTGHLTSGRAAIRAIRKRLQDILAMFRGALTEADAAELRAMRALIDEALAEAGMEKGA